MLAWLHSGSNHTATLQLKESGNLSKTRGGGYLSHCDMDLMRIVTKIERDDDKADILVGITPLLTYIVAEEAPYRDDSRLFMQVLSTSLSSHPSNW